MFVRYRLFAEHSNELVFQTAIRNANSRYEMLLSKL